MRTKAPYAYRQPKAFDRAVWNCLEVKLTRNQIIEELYGQGIDTSYTQVWRSCERLMQYGYAVPDRDQDQSWDEARWIRVGPSITR